MNVVELKPKLNEHQQWQRFWPKLLLLILALFELLLTLSIIIVEFWSMIINVKYSFFFIGFITSILFWLSSISILCDLCCCAKSFCCATYLLIMHIVSIIVSSILLYYDARFLHYPQTCLWPSNFCDQNLLNLNVFGTSLGTGTDIPSLKLNLIKIQIACSAIMIVCCILYIGIYIYVCMKVRKNQRLVNPHATIELGRTPHPPAPFWPPPPPKILPPSSEF